MSTRRLTQHKRFVPYGKRGQSHFFTFMVARTSLSGGLPLTPTLSHTGERGISLVSLRKQGYSKQVHSHAHFVRFSSLFIDYKLWTMNYELWTNYPSLSGGFPLTPTLSHTGERGISLESLRKQGYYKQVRSHAHFVRFSSLFINYKLWTMNYELRTNYPSPSGGLQPILHG